METGGARGWRTVASAGGGARVRGSAYSAERLGGRLEGQRRDDENRCIERREAQARQAAIEAMAMRHLPLAGFLMARRAIAEADDGKGILEEGAFGHVRAQERVRQRLDQDRIGDEQAHDELPRPPSFLMSVARSRHDGLPLPAHAGSHHNPRSNAIAGGSFVGQEERRRGKNSGTRAA